MTTNKAVVTFGERGGSLSGQHVMSISGAARMATDIAHVFGRYMAMDITIAKNDFKVSKRNPRMAWTSCTHYVCVQLLTGEGDYSSVLWRKED